MTKKRLEIFSHFFLFYIILKPPELSIQLNSPQMKNFHKYSKINKNYITGM